MFQEFWKSIKSGSEESLSELGQILPKTGEGIIILLVGFLLGIALEELFVKISEKLKLNSFWQKLGFDELVEKSGIKKSPSRVVGVFLKGIIIIFFLKVAARRVGFVEVEVFLQSVIDFVPRIIVALLIILFTIRTADMAGSLIKNLIKIKDVKTGNIIANITKNILIAFGVMAALVQIKIAPELITILFTGFIAMLALAGGLAFGLGGKNLIEHMLKDLNKKK